MSKGRKARVSLPKGRGTSTSAIKVTMRFRCRERDLYGPNGAHSCLVLELLGLSIADLVESCVGHRLPAHFAKQAAREFLQGLGVLWHFHIGHGGNYVSFVVDFCCCWANTENASRLTRLSASDIHSRNLAVQVLRIHIVRVRQYVRKRVIVYHTLTRIHYVVQHVPLPSVPCRRTKKAGSRRGCRSKVHPFTGMDGLHC